jgi:hypothetical protein
MESYAFSETLINFCEISRQNVLQDSTINTIKIHTHYNMGHAVAQLIEALRYKSEGRGFDSRLCHWNFDIILPAALWPWGLTQPLTEMSTSNVSWG